MTHSFPTRRSSDLEPQLLDAFAQFFEVVGVGGEEAAEDDRLHLLEPRERRRSGFLGVGHRIADARLRDVLDLRGDEADLPGADLGQVLPLGCEAADAVGSEEHTSELQSLMRISYAVFCLKKKKKTQSLANRRLEADRNHN